MQALVAVVPYPGRMTQISHMGQISTGKKGNKNSLEWSNKQMEKKKPICHHHSPKSEKRQVQRCRCYDTQVRTLPPLFGLSSTATKSRPQCWTWELNDHAEHHEMLQEVQRWSSLSNPSGSSRSWVRVTQPPKMRFQLRERKNDPAAEWEKWEGKKEREREKKSKSSMFKSEEKKWLWPNEKNEGKKVSNPCLGQRSRKVIFHGNHIILHHHHWEFFLPCDLMRKA